jgi:hypothetical protein
LTAAQKSKSKGADMSGEQVEELMAEIMGGQVQPGRSNRPVPDLFAGDGTPYSIKTLALTEAASRPEWHQWLGQQVNLPVSRLQPKGALPRGKTLFDTTANALGRRLVSAFNEMIESYGVERLGVLLRLRVESEKLWRYYYWSEEIEAIDPAALLWRDSEHTREGTWTRNIHAHYRDEISGSDRGPAALSWCSASSQLWIRHRIPADADTWVVADAEILSREEATAAILQAIDARLLG